MPRPKALLLDFDDTLLDNGVVPEIVERACHEIAASVDLDPIDLLQANGVAWSGYWPGAEPRCAIGEIDLLDVSREVWRLTLAACGIDDPSVGNDAFETHQRIGDEMTRLFDDVPDLLLAFRDDGIATALVTNSSRLGQQLKLAAVGLGSAFDAVVISGAIGVAKPDPAIFRAALVELQVTRDEAWHVGDSLSTDVAGANAAGIRSVWLNRHGRPLRPSDPTPGVTITSLDDLRSLIADA